MERTNRITLAAFAAMILLAGGNAVGVHIVVQELDPFWAAAVRFLAAGAIFWALMIGLRVPVPTGGALAGALVYGFIGFFLSFSLAFWSLREAPPGAAGFLLALVPLITMLLARVHGLERLHWRPVLGALVAMVGVASLVADRVNAEVPIASLLGMVATAVCFAETGIVVKMIPRAHPVATNAVAITTGGLLLLVLSALVGEDWVGPVLFDTKAAMTFLVLGGSVGVFGLYVFVLERWSASSVSYEFLLVPLVTALYSAVLTGEVLTLPVIAGGLVILGGVYFGAFAPDRGGEPSPKEGQV